MSMADLSRAANGHGANGTTATANVSAPTSPAPTPPTRASFSLLNNIRHLPPVSAFLCVALGGALGALLRYGFIEAFASYQAASTTSTADDGTTVITLHKPFPASTFISNLLGCLLIGLLSILLPATIPTPHTLLLTRHLVITGLLGALTTMSSFALDTAQLLQHQHSKREGEAGVVVVSGGGGGREWVGVVYWVVTNVGGVGLVVVGRVVGRRVVRWYVRWAKRRRADAGRGVIAGQEAPVVVVENAFVREVAEELKEQAMVERGESVDAET